MDANSTITWTHAIGWGPLGPVFIDDLTAAGHDYYLFTDHLGTPFGHHNPTTGTTYHTPTNPWGELLATHPAPAPHYTAQGTVATSGAGGPAFTLPPDATHASSPLGLAGHLYDHHTGLVYMHNRHYHPRLGHFTTPDYRAPDIYDPTTYTEPYAYAGGNPILFYDPNGLIWTESSDRRFAKKQQRRMNGEYDTQLDKFFEVVLGVFGGSVRNTALGGKDFLLLLYSYGESKRRIRTSQVREWFGLSALQGVEDDIAYVNLVNDSLQDLFVNEGIFQTMGQGAADSLNRALSELEKGNYFETGVEGAEFVEVVTMLAALPKAGLSTAKQLRIVGNGEDLLAISDDLLDAHVTKNLTDVKNRNHLIVKRSRDIDTKKLTEDDYRRRVEFLEKYYGTNNVHSIEKHGAHTTALRQYRRVKNIDYPNPSTGQRGNRTKHASKFLTHQDHYRVLRRAILEHKKTGATKVYVEFDHIIGVRISNLGSHKKRGPFTAMYVKKAVVNFDRVTGKFYTAYPLP